MHGTDHAHVVDVLRGVCEQFTDFQAALAPFLELERRTERSPGLPLGRQVRGRQSLAVVLVEQRFRIERVNVTGSAIREDVDNPLGFAWKVRFLGRERVPDGLGRETILFHDLGQAHHAEAHAATAEEFAAGKIRVRLHFDTIRSQKTAKSGTKSRGEHLRLRATPRPKVSVLGSDCERP